MGENAQLTSDFAKLIEEWMPPSQPYLVAVSGGRDSMALLHFLHEAGHRELVVCHVNHLLRGNDSDEDEALVREAAATLGLSFESTRVDVRERAEREKQSIETAAREARYNWFAEVARDSGCHRVVTAHHADDQVETVVMNFFRGSGTRGLAGMSKHSTRSIGGMTLELFRPLLPIRRSEVDRYTGERGIDYREDESNADDFSLRNRVRNRLLPQVEEIFDRDIREAVLRTAELARRQEAWMEEAVGVLPRKSNGLCVKALRGMPEAQRDRILWRWLREEGVTDCGFEEVRKAAGVALAVDRPAKENLPGDRHVRRKAGVLFLEGLAEKS